MGNRFFIDGQALHHLDGLAAQRARNAQLIKAERGGWWFKAGGNFNRRVNADADRDRQRLPHLFRLHAESIDMTAWRQPHRKFIAALDAQTVNGDIRFVSFRVGGIAQTHGDVRARILFGIGWRRQQFTQVEIGISCQMDDFLSHGFFIGQNRWNRALYGIFQQMAQSFGRAVQEVANAFTGAVDADRHADVVKAFDLVEHHHRAIFAGWALAGAAGSNVTIYAG